jgi:hypothetical protein
MWIYHQRARYVRHGDDFAIEVDLVREASVTILFSKVSTDMSDKEKSSGNFNVPIQVVSEPRPPGWRGRQRKKTAEIAPVASFVDFFFKSTFNKVKMQRGIDEPEEADGYQAKLENLVKMWSRGWLQRHHAHARALGCSAYWFA